MSPDNKKRELFASFFGVPSGPSLGVYLRDLGYHKTPPSHNFGPAVRSYWLIHAIKSGKGWFMKDGVKTSLSEGDCFIIRPMEVTTYCSDPDDPWEYYWVGFNGENAAALADYAFSDVSHAHVGAEVVTAASSLYYKYRSKKSVGSLESLSGLYDFLAKLKQSVTPDPDNTPDVIADAVVYIENNYFRPVNITTLADSLGVARAYFTTEFTKRTGVSPYAYLTDYRIKKAQSLLSDSDLRVSEIAYSVGFSGVERFSDMFKRKTGLSPVEYRRRLRTTKTE